jgi:hypothetical protein
LLRQERRLEQDSDQPGHLRLIETKRWASVGIRRAAGLTRTFLGKTRQNNQRLRCGAAIALVACMPLLARSADKPANFSRLFLCLLLAVSATVWQPF